jgi:LPXTG-motif cell wall-anchored protein
VIALIINKPQVTGVEASMGVLGVLGLNAFFVMMFIGSALLFRRSRIRL